MHYNVLFLCTGNSARSIMAEAIMNFKGRPNFSAYSAGSHPSGAVRPEAIAQLQSAHLPTEGLRSKGWEDAKGTKAFSPHRAESFRHFLLLPSPSLAYHGRKPTNLRVSLGASAAQVQALRLRVRSH